MVSPDLRLRKLYIILLCIDYFLFDGTKEVNHVKELFSKILKIRGLGFMKYFLGMAIFQMDK